MPPWAPRPDHWLPHRQSATMELGKWPREKVPGRGVVHLQFGLKTPQKRWVVHTGAALLRLMKYTWSVDPNQSSEYCSVLLRDSLKSYFHATNLYKFVLWSLWIKKTTSCRKTLPPLKSGLLRSRVFSKLPLRCHQTCTSRCDGNHPKHSKNHQIFGGFEGSWKVNVRSERFLSQCFCVLLSSMIGSPCHVRLMPWDCCYSCYTPVLLTYSHLEVRVRKMLHAQDMCLKVEMMQRKMNAAEHWQ